MKKIENNYKIKVSNDFESKLIQKACFSRRVFWGSKIESKFLPHEIDFLFIGDCISYEKSDNTTYFINHHYTQISVADFIEKYGKKKHKRKYAKYCSEIEVKEDFEYPMYFKSKTDDFIVKFESLNSGTIVDGDKDSYLMGYHNPYWNNHTNKDAWTHIPVYEKQEYPIIVGNNYTVMKVLNWYDRHYMGDVLNIKSVDYPYAICGLDSTIINIKIDLRDMILKPLSDEYVKHMSNIFLKKNTTSVD